MRNADSKHRDSNIINNEISFACIPASITLHVLPSSYFFFPPLRLKFRSSTRRSPLCRTIEKQSSSAQQRIPSLFLWRLKFQPATYNACEFFFSRIQIHVPPIVTFLQLWYLFFFRDETGRYECKWKQACRRLQCQERHRQNAMNACCFSISEGVECATPLVSALETLVVERVIRNSLCMRRDFFFFFFLSFSLRKKKKGNIPDTKLLRFRCTLIL